MTSQSSTAHAKLVKRQLRFLSWLYSLSGFLFPFLPVLLIFILLQPRLLGTLAHQAVAHHTFTHHTYYVFVSKATVIFLSICIVFSLILGGLNGYAGRLIISRKHRSYLLMIARLNLLWVPFGTILGLFTLRLLNSDSCKEEYKS